MECQIINELSLNNHNNILILIVDVITSKLLKITMDLFSQSLIQLPQRRVFTQKQGYVQIYSEWSKRRRINKGGHQ